MSKHVRISPEEAADRPNFSYRLLGAIYPAFRLLFPSQVIRVNDLARVMVDVAVRGRWEPESVVFENREIRVMAAQLHPGA